MSFRCSQVGVMKCAGSSTASVETSLDLPALLDASLDVGGLCDAALQIKREEAPLPASRLLLAYHSRFFRDYFKGQKSKNDSLGRAVVPVEAGDLDSGIVQTLLDAMLTGRFRVADDKLAGFLQAVDYLQLSFFRSRCIAVVKGLGLQKAAMDCGTHGAFLTRLAVLGEQYHFPELMAYAAHLGVMRPELIGDDFLKWPLDACRKALLQVTATKAGLVAECAVLGPQPQLCQCKAVPDAVMKEKPAEETGNGTVEDTPAEEAEEDDDDMGFSLFD